MSFLRKIKQNASNIAMNKINEAMASQMPQTPPQRQMQAPPRQRQAPPQPMQQAPQAAPPPGGSVLENALAGLIGSAERFVDKAGHLISSACPNCQTVGVANSACEKCGTQLPTPPALNQEGSARPSNCGNCGASVQSDVCEYCDSRV